VARHVLAWEPFRAARAVGVYLAFGSELDLSEVVAAALAAGKLVAAPRVGAGGRMTMRQLRQGEEPQRHRFGQLEPPAASPVVEPEALDVVLVPGLTFDVRGRRLGYGQGNYDRLLPRLRGGATTVGVTYAALVVPELPGEDHDVPVTHLVTERGLWAVPVPG
jgi:5-formyltetrahydrofolate cyclo-ligase